MKAFAKSCPGLLRTLQFTLCTLAMTPQGSRNPTTSSSCDEKTLPETELQLRTIHKEQSHNQTRPQAAKRSISPGWRSPSSLHSLELLRRKSRPRAWTEPGMKDNGVWYEKGVELSTIGRKLDNGGSMNELLSSESDARLSSQSSFT